MIARFSKCDFWIPEQILDFSIFFPENFFRSRSFFGRSRKNSFSDFFENQKISLKNQYEKIENFENFPRFFLENFDFFILICQ